MISATRRTVMMGTLGVAAIGAMPVALRARDLPAIFIYDQRFTASLELADRWRAMGVPVLDPRDHDLGLAWRGHIPDLLRRGSRIEGATLWSDRFVCESFGRTHGLSAMATDFALPGERGGALRQWVIA